jgi:hypothetical protein
MGHWDAIGYFAAGMVFVAFGMKDMIPLRIVAMLSNLAFVAYGLGLGLAPVWLLHVVLLPLNGWRLAQALRSTGRTIRIDPDVGEGGDPLPRRSVALRRHSRTNSIRAEPNDRRARCESFRPNNLSL